MFRNWLKSINLTENLISMKDHSKQFKFWSNSSSKGLTKMKETLPLSYYSFNPKYMDDNKLNPILIYHGLFTSKDIWQNLVKPLSEQTGRVVYLLDMRNHGESPHYDLDRSDTKSIADDVKCFMDENNISKAILIGHGFGSRAMLQTALDFKDKVVKVVAIDVSPVNHPFIGSKVIDEMIYSVASLSPDMSLSTARLIVKQRLSRYFRDKIFLGYILMNLKLDENGLIKWRFNLPVIRDLIQKGMANKIDFDQKYRGDVLVICGKYGLVTAQDYSSIRNSFPNSKFNFIHRFRHFIFIEEPSKLVNVLVNFIGK